MLKAFALVRMAEIRGRWLDNNKLLREVEKSLLYFTKRSLSSINYVREESGWIDFFPFFLLFNLIYTGTGFGVHQFSIR